MVRLMIGASTVSLVYVQANTKSPSDSIEVEGAYLFGRRFIPDVSDVSKATIVEVAEGEEANEY